MSALAKRSIVHESITYSYDEISDLVKIELAKLTRLEKADIELNENLSSYIVDSIKMIRFACNIAEALNIDYEPTQLIEFDNIADMIRQLESMQYKK